MISFRFHLLSLVAAFLALAVGIVIGTTLADRAIVDGLRSRVDTVSANLDERQAANDRLQAENDRLRGFLDDSGPRLVEGELADQPVVVVAEQGVDGDSVEVAAELLSEAGATVRSRVEVKPEWALDSPEARADAAAALGIPQANAATMRADIAELLIADLASSGTSSDEAGGVADALAAEGLVAHDVLDDSPLEPGQATTFVLVTGTTGEVQGWVVDLATASVAEGSPTLAAEVFDEATASVDETERGARLVALRANGNLESAVATVDDLELVQGRLAAALALADVIDGVVGHYGYGPDVDGAAPEAATP